MIFCLSKMPEILDEDPHYITVQWKPIGDYWGYLIDCLFYELKIRHPTRINREGLIRFEKILNENIKKYLKFDKEVYFPLLEKDDKDIAWCEARLNRHIEVRVKES